jgi:hypothetical protein
VAGGRLLDGLGNPVFGENIWVYVDRYVWDPFLPGYQWFDWGDQLVSTGLGGELTAAGPFVDPGMTFGETDQARVYYYLETPWQRLGTITAYLGSPMVGVPAWFQSFESTVKMVNNLDIEMTPLGGTHFTLRITGDLVHNNGVPASGVDLRIHSWHEEPPGTFNDQDFTDTTGASGGFIFDYPSDNLIFPYDTWVFIDFYDDQDMSLGRIEWNPTLRTWREMFPW